MFAIPALQTLHNQSQIPELTHAFEKGSEEGNIAKVRENRPNLQRIYLWHNF